MFMHSVWLAECENKDECIDNLLLVSRLYMLNYIFFLKENYAYEKSRPAAAKVLLQVHSFVDGGKNEPCQVGYMG